MKVGVLVNGEWDEKWGKLELEDLDVLICADGGTNLAIRSGRIPKVVVGDLDSITPENLALCEQERVEIIQHPREKDETDLELALDYAFSSQPVSEIVLYGATGKRIDHFLGNVALMHQWAKRGKRIILKDPSHELWMITSRETVKGRIGQEVSLIPMTAEAVVSLEGFYYPLQRATLKQESTRGISNVFIDNKGTIEVHKGIVLFVFLK